MNANSKFFRYSSAVLAAAMLMTAPLTAYADTQADTEYAETAETAQVSVSAESGLSDESAPGSYSLSEYENNEIIVVYKNGDIKLVTASSQAELADMLDAFSEDDSVDYFQPNFSYDSTAVYESDAAAVSSAVSSALTSDPYARQQWGLYNNGTFKGYYVKVTGKSGVDADAEKAWKYYTANRETVVAIIDTGIDMTSKDLAGSFWTNEDEIADNGIDDDNNGYVDDVDGWNFYSNNNKMTADKNDYHGTHCAGTITAAKNDSNGIAGLADYDNIKIMSLKALGGSEGTGTTLSIVRAIKYAEDKGAQICNLSLGTESDDPLLYRAIKNSSMLFVVAAGNSSSSNSSGRNIDTKASYPASYSLDNILTVANMKADGALHSSSDYGVNSVDIAAPGTDIISDSVGNKISYLTGTSMAAPFVTATAAMVYAASSDTLSAEEIKEIILDTAVKDSKLTDYVLTGGRLDAGAAVAYAALGTANPGGLSDDTGSSTTQTTTGSGITDDSGSQTSGSTGNQATGGSNGNTGDQTAGTPSQGGYTGTQPGGQYIQQPQSGGWYFRIELPAMFRNFFSYFWF